jgi:hypothetical protein
VVRLARIERNLSTVQCRAASGKVAHHRVTMEIVRPMNGCAMQANKALYRREVGRRLSFE